MYSILLSISTLLKKDAENVTFYFNWAHFKSATE